MELFSKWRIDTKSIAPPTYMAIQRISWNRRFFQGTDVRLDYFKL